MNSWGIEEEKRYYDIVASKATLEEFKNHLDNRMNEIFWPTIFRKIGNLKDRRVLDLGCGLGYDSAILASKGANVVGIDISSGCVEKAGFFLRSMGFGKSTQFRVMDARSLNFPENYFDLVFGRSILHHINPERNLKGVHYIVKDKCCFIEPLSRTEQVHVVQSPEKAKRSPYPHYELSRLIQIIEKEFSHVWHDEYNNHRTIIIASCA